MKPQQTSTTVVPLRRAGDTAEQPLSAAMLARAAALDAIAGDLAGELMLTPLLERILKRCTELVGCDAGSICSIDEAAGVYRKEADIGVRCQVGQVFPLSEGMTGAVVERRGPVWFDRYDEVPGGHISPEERQTLRSVIGVPLEWRGRIIGVCVVFSRDDDRRFTHDDADVMRIFARHAALALANATIHEAAEERARAQAVSAERDRLLAEVQDVLSQGGATMLAHLEDAERQLLLLGQPAPRGLDEARTSTKRTLGAIRSTLLGLASSPLEGRSLEEVLRAELHWAERASTCEARLTVSGTPVALDPRVAHEMVRVAQEALTNVVQHARAQLVRLGLVYDSAAVTLLVQDDGQGFDSPDDTDSGGLGIARMRERTRGVGGSLAVESIEDWGTSIKARFPYPAPPRSDGDRIRVLVVDPRPLVCAGVARLLTWSDEVLTVVGEAMTIDTARESVRRLRPQVLVCGLGVGGDTAAFVGQVLAMDVGVSVLVFGETERLDVVDDLRIAGATGYVDSTVDGAVLAQAVVATARGQSVNIGSQARQLDRDRSRPAGRALTGREQEVRLLVEKGLTDRAIADRLHISVKTAEKHVAAVLRKTGTRNRLEFLAMAAERSRR